MSVSYFYRHASPEATKRFPAVSLLRRVNLFIGGDCSGYEKFLQVVPPWEKVLGTLFCIVIIHASRFSFQMSY